MARSPVLRVALIWMALLAVFVGTSQLAVLLFGPDYATGRHIVMALLTTALVVPLIVLARRYIDQEPFADLGLRLDLSALKPLLVGMFSWLAPFALCLAVLLGLGLVEIRALVPWTDILGFIPLLILLVLLLEALPEELAFRGYIQTNLGKVLEPWLAVTVQAVLFGSWGVALWLITSGGVDPLQASLFYVMGAVLGALRIITGSTWTAIGFHLAFQTAAQLLLNTERGFFQIEGVVWLQVLALGAIPFSLAMPVVERFYREKVDWSAKPA